MDIRHLLVAHPHWGPLQKLYHTLLQNGYKAYLAGGCVRDALLGQLANDLDLATDATPETIEKLFPKTVAVGKAFGVMVVVEEGISFEVATFRSDGSYEDGRRPDTVVFTTPEEDAERRDFTVNALFYDLHQGRVLDFVGGLKDLGDKKVRAVGVAEKRFREDHLRLLRALRFSAQLNFEIESETLAAVAKHAELVKTVSPERIHEETYKLLKTKAVLKGLELLKTTGLGAEIFPDSAEVLEKSQSAYKILFASPEYEEDFLWLKFLTPWVLQNKKSWLWILENYRFSRNSLKSLKKSLELLEKPQDYFSFSVGERLAQIENPGVLAFLKICQLLNLESKALAETLKAWEDLGEKLPEPWVRGEDLKGKLQGKTLGEALQKAYVWQLEKKIANRSELLQKLEEVYLKK